MDLRARLDHLIEHLIDLRDSLDDDPDLEASGDDETWLGGGIAGARSPCADDLELDDADAEPDDGF